MASKIRIDINSGGIQELLKSAPVRALLQAKADRIAAAAGPGMVASSRVGKTRARASVITDTFKAMRAEATDRALTRAIDAGRG
jgi:tRNA A37 threonylcarbamoyltransferase TsaD